MERKVIFHVDECGRFEMAAGNIHNMCSFYRGREIPVVIELLLNGEAVRAAAAAAPEAEGCRELLREEGVEIAVCNNALRKNGIAAEELTEGVRVVPGGGGGACGKAVSGLCLYQALVLSGAAVRELLRGS